MKKAFLALLIFTFVISVFLFGTTKTVEARGRTGSFRVGGYTSHGKGSHYVGGYVSSGPAKHYYPRYKRY